MRASRKRKYLKFLVLAFPLSWLIYLMTDPNVSEDVKHVRGLHPYEIVPPKVEDKNHQNLLATRAIVADSLQEQKFVKPEYKRGEGIVLPQEKVIDLDDNNNIHDKEIVPPEVEIEALEKILPPKIENEAHENKPDEEIEPPKVEGEAHQNVVVDHANVVNPPESVKSFAQPENQLADEVRANMEAQKVLKPPQTPESEVANEDMGKRNPEKFDYGPQSAMLKEIGGYVMNKMPSGFFQNVAFPRFESAYNPKGLGKSHSLFRKFFSNQKQAPRIG